MLKSKLLKITIKGKFVSIKIIEASINSTLQDLGRKNFAQFGIARSGAIDEDSLRLANILLGNKQEEAGLELCLRGGKYEFLDGKLFCFNWSRI